jgi:hypothetical protein
VPDMDRQDGLDHETGVEVFVRWDSSRTNGMEGARRARGRKLSDT